MTKYCDNMAQLMAGRLGDSLGVENHNYEPSSQEDYGGELPGMTRVLTVIIMRRVTIITKYCQNKQENFPPHQHNSTNSPLVFFISIPSLA